MADSKYAVRVNNLSKSFKIPLESSSGIKQKLINTLRGRKGYRDFTPLNDISFDIQKGDFFGIVGRNGSGKSTLLKTMAGIYEPNGGLVEVNGTLIPFIELGVGFNPELSGRENVYLNGALLGFSHSEMDTMYEEIVDFAELHDFMDERLKNYSSGMQVRLAFSIAIRAKGDILLLDEVLAVGDAAFQKKCYDYFDEIKHTGKTVILVTHDMDAVSRFCTRAILIDQGGIKVEGKPRDVADQYLQQNFEARKIAKKELHSNKHGAAITAVHVANKLPIESNDLLEVGIEFVNNTESGIHIGLQIFTDNGIYCYGTNSKAMGLLPIKGHIGKVKVKVKLNLAPGIYQLSAGIMNSEATEVVNYQPSVTSFRIKLGAEIIEGIVPLACTIEEVRS